MNDFEYQKNTTLRKLALPLLGKWTPFIILILEQKNCNFADLERAIPNITRKVLTENLKLLVSMGMISKFGESSTGYPVDYGLTALGKTILPIFYELKNWLIVHQDEIHQNIKKNKL